MAPLRVQEGEEYRNEADSVGSTDTIILVFKIAELVSGVTFNLK